MFVGYPLGRGQEIVHTLTHAGIATAVHGSIARMIPAYEAFGYTFPGWEAYSPGVFAGRALVVVPNFRNYLEASGKDVRIAYVSGWAALSNARARAGAEELIPYSDHADFEELLAIVEGSGARQVDVVHGYTEAFARILRAARHRGARAGRDGGRRRRGGGLMDALARACEEVARFSSRLKKVRVLADYLRPLEEADLARAVRFLAGGPVFEGIGAQTQRGIRDDARGAAGRDGSR